MAEARVAEPFVDAAQQREAAHLGFWVFLATEVLFFSAWFMAYVVFRIAYAPEFAQAARHTHLALGAINTAVLLTSGLTMTLAALFARAERPALARAWLLVTALLGVAFLAIKGVEYHKDYVEGLVPALNFRMRGAGAAAKELFFFLYFGMTGLHALHLTIGIVVLLVLAARAHRLQRATPIELASLYWHFIDVVWVFLFALLYIPGRAP